MHVLSKKPGWVLLVVACCCGLAFAAAACQSEFDGALNTYFFSVSKPAVSLAGTGREGTTRLRVQLRQDQVSHTMPVVTAAQDGVMHNVVLTWQFLQVRLPSSTLFRTFGGQPPHRNWTFTHCTAAAVSMLKGCMVLPTFGAFISLTFVMFLVSSCCSHLECDQMRQ
jgi:hypothetical protein